MCVQSDQKAEFKFIWAFFSTADSGGMTKNGDHGNVLAAPWRGMLTAGIIDLNRCLSVELAGIQAGSRVANWSPATSVILGPPYH